MAPPIMLKLKTTQSSSNCNDVEQMNQDDSSDPPETPVKTPYCVRFQAYTPSKLRQSITMSSEASPTAFRAGPETPVEPTSDFFRASRSPTLSPTTQEQDMTMPLHTVPPHLLNTTFAAAPSRPNAEFFNTAPSELRDGFPFSSSTQWVNVHNHFSHHPAYRQIFNAQNLLLMSPRFRILPCLDFSSMCKYNVVCQDQTLGEMKERLAPGDLGLTIELTNKPAEDMVVYSYEDRNHTSANDTANAGGLFFSLPCMGDREVAGEEVVFVIDSLKKLFKRRCERRGQSTEWYIE